MISIHINTGQQNIKNVSNIYPNFKDILGAKVAGKIVESTVDLAQIFLDEIHVAVVPGEAFGSPGYARLSFALSDEDLAERVERRAKSLS